MSNYINSKEPPAGAILPFLRTLPSGSRVWLAGEDRQTNLVAALEERGYQVIIGAEGAEMEENCDGVLVLLGRTKSHPAELGKAFARYSRSLRPDGLLGVLAREAELSGGESEGFSREEVTVFLLRSGFLLEKVGSVRPEGAGRWIFGMGRK